MLGEKMKLSNLLSTPWLTFMLHLQLGTVTSSDSTMKVSPNSLGTPKFNHLAINAIDGTVFIGAANHLYKLTSDLKHLANGTASKDFDSNSYNNILLINYQDKELITCSSSDTYSICAKYDNSVRSELKIIQNESLSETLGNDANSSTVAVINMDYNCRLRDEYPKVYVAVSYSDNSHSKPAISIKSFNSRFFGKGTHSNIESFFTEYRDKYRVNYVYGFNLGKYNYFLTTQQSSTLNRQPYISKMIRICSDCEKTNGNIWRGYTEIPIECREINNNKSYNLVQVAHIGKPGSELQKSLNISRDDEVLFGVFSKSREVGSNKPSENSALCAYSMKGIDEKFTENIQNCFKGHGNRGFEKILKDSRCYATNFHFIDGCTSDRNMPLDGKIPITASPTITFSTLLTTIITQPSGYHNDIFLGTNTGHLKRVVLNNSSSACELADLPIDEGSPVNSNLFSHKSTHLYVMTEHSLTRIEISLLLKNCSTYNSDYNSCIHSTHKSCAWCGLTNKCTTRCECSSTNQSLWYQYDIQKFINITIHGSNKFQLRDVKPLELNITDSSYLIHNPLYCQYTILNESFMEKVIHCTSQNCYPHCKTPKAYAISNMLQNMNYLNAEVSILTKGIHAVAVMNITFFDCNKYSSCEACVSSMFSCQWNSKERKCIYIYYAETNDYNCKYLAHNCIRCLTLKTKFDCGWCPNKNTCEFRGNCTDQLIYNHNVCPDSSPSITSFWPVTGLWEGGTIITISGRNLGYRFEDICHIKVAGVACIPHGHVPPKSITCKMNKSSHPVNQEGPVEINVNGMLNISSQNFKFVNPKIVDFSPKEGPIYGGNELTIRGENLNAATSTKVFIGNTSCTVFSRNSSTIRCITNSSHTELEANVFMVFDESFLNVTTGSFKYISDPLRDEKGFNKEPKGIPAGGVKILIHNVNPPPNLQLLLHIQDGKQMYNSSCEIQNDSKTAWICLSPSISHIDSGVINGENPREMNVSFIDTGNSNKFFTFENQPHTLLLYPNPEFKYFFNSSVEFGEDYFIIIKGQNINKACQKIDINVTIGNHNCEVISISASQVICQLQKSSNFMNASEIKDDILAEHDYMTILIGGRFYVTIPKQEVSPKDSMKKYIVYCVIIFVLALMLVAFYYIISKNNVAKYLKKLKKTQHQMTKLELCVASECKEAFAELLTQIPTSQTYKSCTILPFLNYHSYVMNILFPNTNDHSIIVRGKAILIHKEEGLQLFEELIMNRRFLLLFVRILENESNFSMNDRVHVASMIMITLQKNMEYCTDILKTLMGELIEKYMRGKNHPKLLLRRTESVVEKMLSAWFSFLLYKSLNKSAGKPLFNLFNAIKEHVNKGPVDMITSQARYCLCENKLIRKKLDYGCLTIYTCISQKTAKIIELESAIDKVPVQVLDCDTISQFKEKSLDAIYHTINCIQSLNPSELNVEWIPDSCSRMILADDDPSSITEGEWRQKNTLRHYGVPDGAVLNLISNKEKNYRSFGMISVKERKELEKNVKYKTTLSFYRAEKMSLIESATPLKQDNDPCYKEWHLIKPYNPQSDDNGNEHMVPEIYLTRLLATKTSLQNFVDELFGAIFKTTNQNSCFPIAIKYMFDFLDDQASKHDVSDPEVVHVWKNNSLLLRFWVNLIKNPNFLFDIHKSNIVDSCLSVIAQVLMDSCSTSEQHLTKDSSSTKLLYAKEISIYRKLVKKYYADIKNMPKISSGDMTAMLAEESKTYGMDFDTNMSVHELFKYGVRYKKKLINALKYDEISKDNLLALKLERTMEIMSAVSNL